MLLPEEWSFEDPDWVAREVEKKTEWFDADLALSDCGDIGFIMDALLERGAEVDAVSADGSAPLHHAAYYSNLVFLRALLDAGADPNRKMRNGLTPLDYAFSRNKPDHALALLEAGAQPDADALECVEDGNAWKKCAERYFMRKMKCPVPAAQGRVFHEDDQTFFYSFKSGAAAGACGAEGSSDA